MKTLKSTIKYKAAFGFMLLIIFTSLSSVYSKQKPTSRYLEVFGKVEYGNKELANAKISVYEGESAESGYETTENGKFDIKLDMNKVYYLHFSKQGMATKIVKVETTVPENLYTAYQYEYKFNVMLDPVMGSAEPITLNKNSAEIFYNPKVDGFDRNREFERELRVERKTVNPAVNVRLTNSYNDSSNPKHGSF